MSGTFVVSQLGARMHYAVPRIFADAGRLAHFYTDISAAKGWPRLLRGVPPRLLPRAVRRLAGRLPRGVPPERMTCFTGLGLRAALRRQRVRTPAEDLEIALWSGEALSRRATRGGFHGAAGVYGFSGECLEFLVAARAQGRRTVVEQMIAPRGIVDRLAMEEEIRFPEWQMPTANNDFARAFAEREKAEWRLADLILCPSDFVRNTVIASGGDPARCALVPYGFDGAPPPRRHFDARVPLRVLVVGAVGLRKGSPYILEAARLLGGAARIRMVGPCDVLAPARAELQSAVEIVGPVPRSDMAAVFAAADVFLLPSICEGSATAVYEALAAGLPVVTTENTGTVVRDGVDGFVVPIRDGTAIAERLSRLADPALREEMAANAAARAAEYTVTRYGERLLSALDALPPRVSGQQRIGALTA